MKHYKFTELFPNELINKRYDSDSNQFNLYYSKMYETILDELLDNYQKRVEMLNSNTEQEFKLKPDLEKYGIVCKTAFGEGDREILTVSNNLPDFGHVDEVEWATVKFLTDFVKQVHRMWTRREKEVEIIEDHLKRLHYIWESIKIANGQFTDSAYCDLYNNVLIKNWNRFKKLEDQIKTIEDYSETVLN